MLKKMDGMVDCQGRLKAFIVSNNLNLLIICTISGTLGSICLVSPP